MNFSELLNYYLKELDCNQSDLAQKSGLSGATVNRYCSGVRTPKQGKNTNALADAIYMMAEDKGILNITRDSVYKSFSSALMNNGDFERFRTNLNALINVLSIRISDLATDINYDASYISRIRSGQRRPSNLYTFATSVADFTSRHHSSPTDLVPISVLIGSTPEKLRDRKFLADELFNWLIGKDNSSGAIFTYLQSVDNFNIDEYISGIRFTDIEQPPVMPRVDTSSLYYGIDEMKAAELEFMDATILGKSDDAAVLYSDMPLMEMARDRDFSKKWIYGLSLMLRKGLTFKQIHDVSRPFDEMMIGLESWIPLYMTGQIEPYYLKSAQNNSFMHLLKTSGNCVLVGLSISGHQHNGIYYLSTKPDDIRFYRRMSYDLLNTALPLMKIYTKKNEKEFQAVLSKSPSSDGDRRAILSSPPIWTISDDLLDSILIRHGIDADTQVKIKNYISKKRLIVENVLEKNHVTAEIAWLTEEEYKRFPVSVSLSEIFCEYDITYTYDEYKAHLDETEKYAETHKGFNVIRNNSPIFRNIQIYICYGKWVLIEKNKSPSIHFMIKNPKLRSAIENMSLPGAAGEPPGAIRAL